MSPAMSWAALSLIVPFAWAAAKTIQAVDAAHTRRSERRLWVPFRESCVCGHDRTVHEHYRRGTECAGYECQCRRFEPEILARVQR